MREPLTHFVVGGALIFAAAHAWEAHTSRYNLELGADQLQRLALTYAQQYGTPPSARELKAIADGYVREEVLRREGVAMGLDRDDEIIRRRIAQKFEFLLQDRAAPGEPSKDDLARHFASHRQLYTEPARRSFDQRYFAADRRGDAAARRLAEVALAAVGAGQRPPAGDSFPGAAESRLLSQADTDRLFGGGEFARQVFAAPELSWSGPFRSGFGWHLVRVSEAQSARRQAYDEVADRVAQDWKQARRQAMNDRAYAEIRARYHVKAPATQQ